MVWRIAFLACTVIVSGLADLVIPLTPVDASFVIHGNKLGAGSKITVTHNCVSCKVAVTVRDLSGGNTSLSALDSTGATYNTSSLGGSVLSPPLSVSVGQGSSTHFILAFTTVQLNQTNATNSALAYTASFAGETLAYNVREVADGGAVNLTINGNSIARMAVTVVSDAKSMPQMHLQGYSLYPNNDNCQADLYAGGIPTTYGKDKYFLLTLRSKDQGNFALSTITVSAFTMILPLGCDVRLNFVKTPPTNIRQLLPGAYGFAMSNEFPGSFVGEQTARNTTLDYVLSDFNTKLHFKVISADPGTGGQLVFREPKTNVSLVISTNTNKTDFDPPGAYPKVTWSPAGPSRNGYLYTIVVSLPPVETTTRDANSLSIGFMMISLLVRYLIC